MLGRALHDHPLRDVPAGERQHGAGRLSGLLAVPADRRAAAPGALPGQEPGASVGALMNQTSAHLARFNLGLLAKLKRKPEHILAAAQVHALLAISDALHHVAYAIAGRRVDDELARITKEIPVVKEEA